MSTITQSSAENDNATVVRDCIAAVLRGAIDHTLGGNVANSALTHNHCGWPGIGPTNPSGVGDILYWTTPGAFHYGDPIDCTSNPQP
jgi:hypothetical protein